MQFQTTVQNQIVHFQAVGNGLPIVLFHASPSSSKMFAPLIADLSQHFLVIAPDTPGYGQSQPLQSPLNDISAYAQFFHQFLRQLGISKCAIYGTATGAQIGIRYGLMFPETVSHLFLDNTAHFTETQRNRILTHYFPDLTPQLDGSHLNKTWKIVRQMFQYFPWYETGEKYRLPFPPMPASVLHPFAKDFIQAGANYSTAYRAAFQHEKAEYVQVLNVPTTLFNWAASIIRPYTIQLLQYNLPSNVTVVDTPADRLERQQTMVQNMQHCYVSGHKVSLETVLARVAIGGKKESLFLKYGIDLPQVKPNLEGSYLQEAWHTILEQNGKLAAKEVHQILKEWLHEFH